MQNAGLHSCNPSSCCKEDDDDDDCFCLPVGSSPYLHASALLLLLAAAAAARQVSGEGERVAETFHFLLVFRRRRCRRSRRPRPQQPRRRTGHGCWPRPLESLFAHRAFSAALEAAAAALVSFWANYAGPNTQTATKMSSRVAGRSSQGRKIRRGQKCGNVSEYCCQIPTTVCCAQQYKVVGIGDSARTNGYLHRVLIIWKFRRAGICTQSKVCSLRCRGGGRGRPGEKLSAQESSSRIIFLPPGEKELSNRRRQPTKLRSSSSSSSSQKRNPSSSSS